jgi:two-component system phosphate regulon sensor histidine kinase PhoR
MEGPPANLSDETRQSKTARDESLKDGAGKDWIAEVSHELRLPIANIRLLVETLLDGALDDREVCRRMLKRAHQEVDRLQRLVADLLSVEQVSQAQDELKCQWINLKERAHYALESINSMASGRGVKVKLDIAPDFLIYANLEQLDQVLLNLVENAVKFTGSQGTVTVSSLTNPGCFAVSDTGIGMSEHEIPKIFQRFYRIDRSQSKGSTGLGLSIVKHILDMHGGRIVVTSKEGVGSTFEVYFPPARE